MLEVLQFIFSSFWIWLGTLILVCASLGTLGTAIGEAMGRRGK